MNLPNKLTVSRFVLTGLFLIAMFWHSPYNDTAALVFFCVAGITDFLDGKIARDRNLITNFGKLMDPLADKILTCSAFIALVERGQRVGWMGVKVEAWMVVIIVARELAITGLRLLAASKNVVLAAEGYGKHKTISQITAILSVLVLTSHLQWGGFGKVVFGFPLLFDGPWVGWFTRLAIWVAVSLTALSGWFYLWRNRQLYLQDL